MSKETATPPQHVFATWYYRYAADSSILFLVLLYPLFPVKNHVRPCRFCGGATRHRHVLVQPPSYHAVTASSPCGVIRFPVLTLVLKLSTPTTRSQNGGLYRGRRLHPPPVHLRLMCPHALRCGRTDCPRTVTRSVFALETGRSAPSTAQVTENRGAVRHRTFHTCSNSRIRYPFRGFIPHT